MNDQKKDIKIMIVDDEMINLRIVDGMLKLENYTSILVNDPLSAVDMVAENKPDLILLDVDMPRKDGFTICKELKQDPETKNIPILFLSGRSSSEYIIEGLKIGGVDYITKPFHAPELLARVNTHLKLKDATEKLIVMENIKALHAAMVSQNHNLNQLTTSILGQTEIINIILNKEIELNKEKIHSCLGSIEKAALDMNNIIQKFKNIQKIEYTKYSKNTDMLDLNRSSIPEEEL
ncbi:MAG: response regulator [Candidatus Delongbacteria bacterium]|nr:response regulator [Candidatus Delongbacteria bacterium]